MVNNDHDRLSTLNLLLALKAVEEQARTSQFRAEAQR